jgi:hypothetical protein
MNFDCAYLHKKRSSCHARFTKNSPSRRANCRKRAKPIAATLRSPPIFDVLSKCRKWVGRLRDVDGKYRRAHVRSVAQRVEMLSTTEIKMMGEDRTSAHHGRLGGVCKGWMPLKKAADLAEVEQR